MVIGVNRVDSTKLPPYSQKDEKMVEKVSIYTKNIGYYTQKISRTVTTFLS